MATPTATDRTYHATLSAGAADTVTFLANYRDVSVVNRSSTDTIYARTDGATAGVAAAGTFAILPGQSLLLHNWQPPDEPATAGSNTLKVSLISSGAAPYSLHA